MEDNRDLVGRKLDIQFDPVSGIYCSLKGGKGVFRNLMVIIMQSPVGKNVPRKGELSARRILGCIRNTYSAARQMKICKNIMASLFSFLIKSEDHSVQAYHSVQAHYSVHAQYRTVL